MSASAPEPAFSPHTKVISPAKPAVLSSFVGPVTEKTVWLNRNVLSDAPPGYKDGIQWVKPDEMTMTMADIHFTPTMTQLEFSYVAELEGQHTSLHASTGWSHDEQRFAIYSGAPSLRWFATTGEIPSMSKTLGSALLVLSQGSIPEVAEQKLQSLCYDATVETD
ncbi:uncharacterized protein YALI1_D19829g [Yarrowia lipolytica]|uniref:Uncharacterized protein n=1 Tax=Yarrowia lipolytica TaxID=4952 RepID=A0A1D8NET6_YARLL|nr:hypothetical protein YALI1_D19829g [Yarrowia lipolytica]